jgi:hypothetical protein
LLLACYNLQNIVINALQTDLTATHPASKHCDKCLEDRPTGNTSCIKNI